MPNNYISSIRATAIYYSPVCWGMEQILPLEEQINFCANYIQRQNNLHLTRIYKDKKAETDGAWQHLLEDVERGVIQGIVVYAAECIGNTAYDLIRELREFLLPCHITFVDLYRDYNSSANNSQQYIDQLEHDYARYRANKSSQERSQNKIIKKRAIPYGYRYVEKEPFILEDEATSPIVRKIFQLAEEGYPLHSIVTWVQKQGACTPGHRKYELYGYKDSSKNTWSEKQVRTILANEIYTGDFVSMKGQAHNEAGRERTVKPPEDECIFLKNHHTPLITKKSFEAVQPNKRKIERKYCNHSNTQKQKYREE